MSLFDPFRFDGKRSEAAAAVNGITLITDAGHRSSANAAALFLMGRV